MKYCNCTCIKDMLKRIRKLKFLLIFCGLFYDDSGISDYMASDGTTTGK
jgi:hypothetical protein